MNKKKFIYFDYLNGSLDLIKSTKLQNKIKLEKSLMVFFLFYSADGSNTICVFWVENQFKNYRASRSEGLHVQSQIGHVLKYSLTKEEIIITGDENPNKNFD